MRTHAEVTEDLDASVVKLSEAIDKLFVWVQANTTFKEDLIQVYDMALRLIEVQALVAREIFIEERDQRTRTNHPGA